MPSGFVRKKVLEVYQHMKKVFTILLALSAIGIVMTGCSGEAKADVSTDPAKPADTESK